MSIGGSPILLGDNFLLTFKPVTNSTDLIISKTEYPLPFPRLKTSGENFFDFF